MRGSFPTTLHTRTHARPLPFPLPSSRASSSRAALNTDHSSFRISMSSFACIWTLVLFVFVSYIVHLTCHSLNSCGQFAMKFFILCIIFYGAVPCFSPSFFDGSTRRGGRWFCGRVRARVCCMLARLHCAIVHRPMNAARISACPSARIARL